MRYPIDIQFKIDQKYGDKTSYGYHDGVDMNGLGGGNTDLGTPLKAVARGIITSVHDHQTGWGKHLHLKFETPFGTHFAHYAHCQEILVREGQEVEEGIVLAKMGNTGSSTAAHLHFSIKNRPTGIDAVAKTLEELKSWEDPLVFIDACNKAIIEGNEIEGLKELLKTRDLQILDANKEIDGLKVQVKANEDRYNNFLDHLWERLDHIGTGEKGEATILADIEKLIVTENDLLITKKKLEEANKEAVEFVEEIARGLGSQVIERKAVLRDLVRSQTRQKELFDKIEALNQEIEDLKKIKTLSDYQLGMLLSEIINRIFRRGGE